MKRRKKVSVLRNNDKCGCGAKKENWQMSVCQRCLERQRKYDRKKLDRIKKLYRPPTDEEKNKYAGLTRKKVLKAYYDYLY